MKKKINSNLLGKCIAEFLGTSLIVFFITGCCASFKLTEINLSQWEISIISGLGVSMAIYMSIKISGAHLNPAVTIALCINDYFNKKEALYYIISQFLGSFFASLLIYYLYSNLFDNFIKNHHIIKNSIESLYLSSIFSTYPNPQITIIQSFFTEFTITTIFMVIIMILTQNYKNNTLLLPLIIGLLIGIIGGSVGSLTGFALNPARDLSPKILTWLLGWGNIVFTGNKSIPYFIIPIIGPLLGTNFGVIIYKKLIKTYIKN